MQLRSAGATTTGRVRDHNEDAHHVGESVFAVADGMGGHLGGEVASATALRPIAVLDGRVFGSPEEAVRALAGAVHEANTSVVGAAADDPGLHGMGTTLTAALFEGRRLHVAHVGDSRAYLLRDGAVGQLTRDHTFVQQLLDDGSISPEEAARHPHRSVVTRAIGVDTTVDVDQLSLELEPGDQVLLCSDGLSGVIAEGTLANLLRSGRPPGEVVRALLGAADAAGSPDNVTAVLLVVEPDPSSAQRGRATHGADGDDATQPGDGSSTTASPIRIRPDADAGPARPLPGPGPDDGHRVDPAQRRQRVLGRVVGAALVVGLFVGGGWWLLSRSWYVGVDGDLVTIHRGVPVSLGPLELGWADTATSLRLDMVAAYQVERLVDGIAAIDRSDAEDIVERLREQGREEVAGTDDGATPPPSGTGDGASEGSTTTDGTGGTTTDTGGGNGRGDAPTAARGAAAPGGRPVA